MSQLTAGEIYTNLSIVIFEISCFPVEFYWSCNYTVSAYHYIFIMLSYTKYTQKRKRAQKEKRKKNT